MSSKLVIDKEFNMKLNNNDECDPCTEVSYIEKGTELTIRCDGKTIFLDDEEIHDLIYFLKQVRPQNFKGGIDEQL